MKIDDVFPPKIHAFATEKEWSEAQELFWQSFYRRAFPNMVSMMSCPGNCESQKRGIDRVILLSNSRIVKVEEKARKEHYGDILLEYLSNDQTQTPGWMEKDLEIDYLAYAFISTKVGYLFDWPILKLTWDRFKGEWKNRYHDVSARNNGYVTHSVAIPTGDLLGAISRTRMIRL